MKAKNLVVILPAIFGCLFLTASPIFGQNKSVSDCVAARVIGGLPAAVSIPQTLCVDEKKPADASEKVKAGNNLKNSPNQTVNQTNLVYGGLQPDLKFAKLPKEVQHIVKLTFPEIAADAEQLYLLTVTAEPFPETGKSLKLVKKYSFSLQTIKNRTPLPKMPTWDFIRQGGKLRLRNLEVLNWNAAEQTYK